MKKETVSTLLKVVLWTVVCIVWLLSLAYVTFLPYVWQAAYMVVSMLFLLVMVLRKCGKMEKRLLLPIGVVCCILSYFIGSVVGPGVWRISDGMHLYGESYGVYRWSTYIWDCVGSTISWWAIVFGIIHIVRRIKKAGKAKKSPVGQ